MNGLFRQEIHDGWQVELPEDWLAHGNPWEFERREVSLRDRLRWLGRAGRGPTVDGATSEPAEHVDGRRLRYAGRRLARDAGQHAAPVECAADRPDPARRLQRRRLYRRAGERVHGGEPHRSCSIPRLHPGRAGASTAPGVFLLSASLQDIIRRHVQFSRRPPTLPDKAAIQLNDTHPAVSVAELMRLLIDIHGLDFDEAWAITQATFGYTNHTLMPEALETWPVTLFERLLPRHMQIIYAINARLLERARRERQRRRAIGAISLIDESGDRRVRMANLAFTGSHSVNGVAALHTELMKKTVFADFTACPRPDQQQDQWRHASPLAVQCNPGLTGCSATHRRRLPRRPRGADRRLDAFADDSAFQRRFKAVKRANKPPCRVPARADGTQIDPGDVRRAEQAHPRVQKATAQHHRRGRALQSLRRPTRLVPPHQAVQRQGRAGLSHRQAHHQADQRRRDVINHDSAVRDR